MAPDTVSNLWDFSLALYARADVADACVRLQDEHGVNVNLLLWCIWLEQQGIVLDTARLHTAQKRIHAWDEHYVIPLRQLRRRMKAEFGVNDDTIEGVRSQIKQAELLAEKQLQLWLEAVTHTWDEANVADTYAAVGGNIRFYLEQLNIIETDIVPLLDMLNRPLD